MKINMSNILSVSQVNTYIRSLIDGNRNLSNILISGEISNFTDHYRTGHLYFSLKDSKSVLKAVMFNDSARRLKFMPKDGMKVIVSGKITVYEPSGQYQIIVKSMQPDGVGALHIAYEQLKEKLSKEGLFDKSRPLPEYPKKIAVITSETGAAVQDIKNILGRRWPIAEINLIPCTVQGEYAEGQLTKAVKQANTIPDVDIIIIGRGGGSIEDLWAFNSEKLARAIYDSKIPVISAVGHETDFTICDFVSDLRAPTPSAAAELAVPDVRDVMGSLLSTDEHIKSRALAVVNEKSQQLDLLSSSRSFKSPNEIWDSKKRDLDVLSKELKQLADGKLKNESHNLSETYAKLEALNPLNILLRGYSAVTKDDKFISSVANVSVGDKITIKMSDGSVSADVTEVSASEG